MTERPPWFSVVMPLYNKAAHVGATVAAIAAQSVAPAEVIVVDDGSTDDGPARVRAAGIAGLRVVEQRNAGPGLARNRGIAEARGDWVAFLDADDLWAPDHLATLARTIAACPDADLVATGFVRGEDARAIDQGVAGAPRWVDYLAEPDAIWTSAVAVRRAVIQREGFGAAWPGEDVELWMRLALRHRFAVHPRRTAVYVQRTGGAMDSFGVAAPAAPIEDQPVFATVAAVLADPAHAARHAAVARFRDRLMLDWIRPSLFNGQVALARAYLRALHGNGVRTPIAYRVLARLPGPTVRVGSRAWGRIKRALRR